AFSDFHGLFGLKDYFREVKQKLLEVKPDILVFCGDFRNNITIPLLRSRLRTLKFSNIFYVWGNSDLVKPEFDLKIGTNLHLNLVPLNNEFGIIGIGGSKQIKTNFGFSCSTFWVL
ncbi:MAG: metallophosphoesterase, partial [Candidatus Helarchaeota archaeon]